MRLEIYVILREPEVKHILEKKKKKKRKIFMNFAQNSYLSILGFFLRICVYLVAHYSLDFLIQNTI